MKDAASDTHSGYALLIFSRAAWFVILAMALLASGAIALELLSDPPSTLGAAAKTGALAAGLAIVGIGGIRFLLGFGIAEGIDVMPDRLSLYDIGDFVVADVRHVQQLYGNPFFWQEWPVRSWRHWLQVDLARGVPGRVRTYFVWVSNPVSTIRAVADAGFSAQEHPREP